MLSFVERINIDEGEVEKKVFQPYHNSLRFSVLHEVANDKMNKQDCPDGSKISTIRSIKFNFEVKMLIVLE